MEVFSLRADADRFQNIQCIEKDALDLTYKFNGKPMRGSWRPVKCSLIRDQEHQARPSSDFPAWESHIPVFSRRAVDSLHDVLAGEGELLWIDCPDGDYFAFNVTKVIDALDTERSEVLRFPSSGRIMDITRFEFHRDAIDSVAIFKIPPLVLADVFVTELFVSRVQEAQLTGFRFKKLWSSG